MNASGCITPTVFELLRDRSRALGLPCWRCDTEGRILAEPQEPGAAGLWLRSRPICDLVGKAAAVWKDQSIPEPVELFAGCWAIPIAEVFRRDRTGYAVSLAMSHDSLQDEWFEAGCTSAQLDAHAARRAVGVLAHHHPESVPVLCVALRAMAHDLSRASEDSETIAGFTRQLTDGFETIDLLYSFGRSMSDLAQPRRFVETVCQRVQASTSFRWVGAWFGADQKVASVIGGSLAVAGSGSVAPEELSLHLPSLLERSVNEPKAMIINDLGGRPLPDDGQLLVQPIARAGRVIGFMFAGDKGGDDPQVSSYDIHLLEATGGYVGAFLENAVLYAEQQRMFIGTIRALTSSIDAKDRYTFGHSDRVAHLGLKLAEALGLPAEVCERIHVCGLLHDVGKIGVPEAVLCKPGRLTEEEFEQIKMHPAIGHRILKDIPLLEDILPGVLHHHERFDGKGYPAGLTGTDIPLFARILALADTFDAMSSNRAYRPAMPREKVLAEFQRCAGTQFDPGMVGAFLSLNLAEYDRLVAQAVAQQTVGPQVTADAARS